MTGPVKGLSVSRIHFSADPEKATEAWQQYAREGQSEAKWNREMEMDARAGALTAVFRQEYRPDTHERHLVAPRGYPLLHAWDFGKGFPARVWFGRTPSNGLRVYASLVGENVQLRPFAQSTVAHEVHLWGELRSSNLCYADPAGNQDKDDGKKSVEVLREFGWAPRWRGSRIEEGIEELSRLMLSTQPDGTPMFLIDPRQNATLCAALRGEYSRGASGEPERRHPFIDAMDALRYAVINTKPAPRPKREQPRVHFNPESGYGRAVDPAHARDPFATMDTGF